MGQGETERAGDRDTKTERDRVRESKLTLATNWKKKKD